MPLKLIHMKVGLREKEIKKKEEQKDVDMQKLNQSRDLQQWLPGCHWQPFWEIGNQLLAFAYHHWQPLVNI